MGVVFMAYEVLCQRHWQGPYRALYSYQWHHIKAGKSLCAPRVPRQACALGLMTPGSSVMPEYGVR